MTAYLHTLRLFSPSLRRLSWRSCCSSTCADSGLSWSRPSLNLHLALA